MILIDVVEIELWQTNEILLSVLMKSSKTSIMNLLLPSNGVAKVVLSVVCVSVILSTGVGGVLMWPPPGHVQMCSLGTPLSRASSSIQTCPTWTLMPSCWWIHLFNRLADQNDVYFKPWCRVAPYVVGIVTGYFLYITEGTRFKMHKVSEYRFIKQVQNSFCAQFPKKT